MQPRIVVVMGSGRSRRSTSSRSRCRPARAAARRDPAADADDRGAVRPGHRRLARSRTPSGTSGRRSARSASGTTNCPRTRPPAATPRCPPARSRSATARLTRSRRRPARSARGARRAARAQRRRQVDADEDRLRPGPPDGGDGRRCPARRRPRRRGRARLPRRALPLPGLVHAPTRCSTLHQRLPGSDGGAARARASCSSSSASPRRAAAGWRRCPRACSSGSASPRRWSAARGSCCSTSRRARSTRPAGAPCATCSWRCATAASAVLLNSHLLSEVELVCDRVVIIDRGRVVAAGAPGGAGAAARRRGRDRPAACVTSRRRGREDVPRIVAELVGRGRGGLRRPRPCSGTLEDAYLDAVRARRMSGALTIVRPRAARGGAPPGARSSSLVLTVGLPRPLRAGAATRCSTRSSGFGTARDRRRRRACSPARRSLGLAMFVDALPRRRAGDLPHRSAPCAATPSAACCSRWSCARWAAATLLLGRLLAAAAVCAVYVVVVYFGALLITGAIGDWWPDRVVGPGAARWPAGVVRGRGAVAARLGVPVDHGERHRDLHGLRRRPGRRAARARSARRSTSDGLANVAHDRLVGAPVRGALPERPGAR